MPKSNSSLEITEYIENTVFIVFGASGDLSNKKIFPAIFELFIEGHLSSSTKIIGYARSSFNDDAFRCRLEPYLMKSQVKHEEHKRAEFLKMISYVSGAYDKDEGFVKLSDEIKKFVENRGIIEFHFMFYLALPPAMFVPVAQNIKKHLYVENGNNKVIVEKPFGRDLKSFRELQSQLGPLFKEEEIFRIDHYLGKEMVKNLVFMRFNNFFLNSVWDKRYIQMIQISFKEQFGTEGRGGYFDSIGIIRDVVQNHLLQILTLLTMERPACFDHESIRDEKVKVLKSIEPIDYNDILIGQYGKSIDGSKPAYVDDHTVSNGSKCITFAALTFKIRNERWDSVPIVMKAGKALDEGKVEIRIMFKKDLSGMFDFIPNNELVIRIQPSETIYFKFNIKTPGLENNLQVTKLDMACSDGYKNQWIPEAYETLIRDALLGDHSNFVRDDELDISWKIFTPLLNHLEGPDGPSPHIYPYGSRGPSELKKYLEDHGYIL